MLHCSTDLPRCSCVRFTPQATLLPLIRLTRFSRFFSYGQFARVTCIPSVFLRAGSLDITLTASGENAEEFHDLALFSVELESDGVREEV
jgi:hypothetical protein